MQRINNSTGKGPETIVQTTIKDRKCISRKEATNLIDYRAIPKTKIKNNRFSILS